jgi:small subunit ribosomal protein S20
MLLDGQVLEQVRLVRHECELALGGNGICNDVVAVDRDTAGGRAQNAGERPQGGCLARTVGTDESDDLAGAGFEREIVDRHKRRPARSGISSREVLDSKGHVLRLSILEVVIDVASHASALKAHRQSLKNRERNRQYRSRLRNALREIRSAVDGNNMKAAKNALKQTVSLIDKMTTKGVIHRNAAGRYKSRLTRRLSSRSA